MIFVGTIFVAIVTVGFFLWAYERGRQEEVAANIAYDFLKRRSIDFGEFEGPILRARPSTENVFMWYSDKRTPALRLEVSPLGDIVCLYEVLGPKELRQIECEQLN